MIILSYNSQFCSCSQNHTIEEHHDLESLDRLISDDEQKITTSLFLFTPSSRKSGFTLMGSKKYQHVIFHSVNSAIVSKNNMLSSVV